MAAISVHNLTHRYGSDLPPSLDGVELEVADGEAHALLGASGAGKTTLLHLLAGLLVPSSGQLMMDGVDVTGLNGRARNIAQVFQFPVLYPAMTVAENLAFPLRNQGWRKTDSEARVREVSRLLGIDDRLTARPGQLSLFEKQLAAIGRALVRPDVSMVLLDEPLTAVEPSIKWQLRNALRQTQAELGLTMVYVTHDQVEALTFAERISMLMHGQILQTGTPSELYECPRTEEVARFVGSPGMNLLPASVVDGHFVAAERRLAAAPGVADGECRIGFRPEWARAHPSGEGVPVTVRAARAVGTRGARTEFLYTLDCLGEQVFTRQVDSAPLPERAVLEIDATRMVAYRNEVLIDAA